MKNENVIVVDFKNKVRIETNQSTPVRSRKAPVVLSISEIDAISKRIEFLNDKLNGTNVDSDSASVVAYERELTQLEHKLSSSVAG